MHGKWLFAFAFAMLMAGHTLLPGDWKSELAKKAVGKIAQEGIEEAVEDALKDAAFDAAVEAARLDRIRRDAEHALHSAAIGSKAGGAARAAMKAADVASSIDGALDAAEAAKKIHKTRKAIKRIVD